jgi:hypothetical protein
MDIVSTPGVWGGHFDAASSAQMTGWAWNEALPNEPIAVLVLINDVPVARVIADRYREDLERAGIGDGRHAFELTLSEPLSPLSRHSISVRYEATGEELFESPRIIEALRSPGMWWGQLDIVSRDRITGWAWNDAWPDEPITVTIMINDVVVERVMANRYREDLETSGIGNGRHAFDMPIPGGLSPLSRHVVTVTFEATGAELHGSPVVIEPADSFDSELETVIDRFVGSLTYGAEQDRVLTFLAAQVERLLQQRATMEGQVSERLAYREFRRRWGGATALSNDDATADSVLDPGPRALVIDDQFPAIDRDAGSQAVLSHMRAVKRLGYSVSFTAANEMTRGRADGALLEAEGIVSWCAPYYASVEEVLRRQAYSFDVIYLHRISNASKYMALARQYCPKARILYSVADLHHVRFEQQARIEDRPELLALSRYQRLLECTAAWLADAVITHSSEEARILRQAVPQAKVHVIAWDVPVRHSPAAFADRSGLAFIGGYTHAPNVDAAHILVKEIMPRVWQTDPGIECLLVGSAMPESVLALAGPGVSAIGHVANLDEIFNRVRLTVAPLRYGAGIKGKVLTSLAAGIPCAMSAMAAEGLGLSPELQGLVAADDADLATLICRLHGDAAANHLAEIAGQAFVARDFSETDIALALQAAIEGRKPLRPVESIV